jgi:hypothetical protein
MPWPSSEACAHEEQRLLSQSAAHGIKGAVVKENRSVTESTSKLRTPGRIKPYLDFARGLQDLGGVGEIRGGGHVLANPRKPPEQPAAQPQLPNAGLPCWWSHPCSPSPFPAHPDGHKTRSDYVQVVATPSEATGQRIEACAGNHLSGLTSRPFFAVPPSSFPFLFMPMLLPGPRVLLVAGGRTNERGKRSSRECSSGKAKLWDHMIPRPSYGL